MRTSQTKVSRPANGIRDRIRRCPLVASISILAALGGCGDREQHNLVADRGRICAYGTLDAHTGPENFAENAPIFLYYTLPTVCLSSSCTQDRTAMCSVAVDGNTVSATTQAEWTVTGGPPVDDSNCTADCRVLEATCQSPALSAGSYTFAFASATFSFSVPSQIAVAPCVEN
jgi:hypothetical protein